MLKIWYSLGQGYQSIFSDISTQPTITIVSSIADSSDKSSVSITLVITALVHNNFYVSFSASHFSFPYYDYHFFPIVKCVKLFSHVDLY